MRGRLAQVHVPEGLRMIDLDLVKLTAQFVARNGKGFLTDLAAARVREAEFNFLKPTHSMFTFFTALCDAYSRTLMMPAGTVDKLRRNAGDRCARPTDPETVLLGTPCACCA